MKFDTNTTTPGISEMADGTSLQGHVTATYAELVDLFGKPTDGDKQKVDAEWYVLFEDGTFATIYNYKDGKAYCGEAGKATESITDWHVGGIDAKSVARVQIAIDLHREVVAAEKSGKPENEAHKAFNDANETRTSMLDSILAHKGEAYRNAVIAGVCAIKLSELNSVMLSMLTDHGMPTVIRKALREAHGQMVAQMLGAAARSAGIEGDNKAVVDELMEWADKINKVEQSAAKKIVEFVEKEDE